MKLEHEALDRSQNTVFRTIFRGIRLRFIMDSGGDHHIIPTFSITAAIVYTSPDTSPRAYDPYESWCVNAEAQQGPALQKDSSQTIRHGSKHRKRKLFPRNCRSAQNGCVTGCARLRRHNCSSTIKRWYACPGEAYSFFLIADNDVDKHSGLTEQLGRVGR